MYWKKMLQNATIKLSDQEKRISNLLINVGQYIQSCQPDRKPVTLRFAGGWVRDKILRKNSHDIDVAIDTMTGYDFAAQVHEYVTLNIKDPSIVGHVSKIKSNPEKSKHLETATVRIYGLEIDFVNLRTEKYTEGSRIPQIVFGTPLEDASRRDLTINSLFYNIHTQQIEDFLGNGVHDLHEGIIRTPLPAYETFKDDPLRILRSIRFASRFGYRVVTEIKKAAQKPEIKRALSDNISKERVGEEIKKMMEGPRPILAVEYLYHFDLYDSVFHLPGHLSNGTRKLNLSESVRSVKALSWFLDSDYVSKFDDLIMRNDDEGLIDSESRLLLFLAASLSPYSSVKITDSKKSLQIDAIEYVMKNSLKMSNFESQFVNTLGNQVDDTIELVRQVNHLPTPTQGSHEYKLMRKRIGSYLRKLGSRPLNSKYYLEIIYAAVHDISLKLVHACPMAHSSDITSLEPQKLSNTSEENIFDENFYDTHDHLHKLPDSETIYRILRQYLNFFALVKSMHLEDAFHEKPMLNGNEIMEAVLEFYSQKGDTRELKRGSWLASTMDLLIDWQFYEQGPNDYKTKQDCRNYVQKLLENETIQVFR